MIPQKSCSLALVGMICLAGAVSGQTTYHWTAGGDGTSWTDPLNWDNGVPVAGSTFQIWIDPQLSSLQTITLGQSVNATASDNVFLEWGQTLNVYGTISSGLFFSPVGGVGGPTTTINLYGNGSISSADSFFIGDPFWVNGSTIPNVTVNMYDNSQLTTHYIGMAGHLNIYGGTATATLGFLTGTATWGPWGSPPSSGPATTDATRLINVAGGELVIGGNATAQATDLINRGILEGDGIVGNVNVDVVSDPGFTVITAVPEPATAAVLGMGGLMVISFIRRRFSA